MVVERFPKPIIKVRFLHLKHSNGDIEINRIKMNTQSSSIMYTDKNEKFEFPIWDIKDFDIEKDSTSIYSQMAYKFNGDLKEGYYVEIGAGHYKDQSNTYNLEKDHGWKGVSIDISADMTDGFNKNRSNPCLNVDALSFNWSKYLEENKFPKNINFLSIDIDSISNDYANLLALLNFPLSQYNIGIIVIEHEAGMYYHLEKLKTLQRDILIALGYNLILRGDNDDVWTSQAINSANGLAQINRLFKRVL